MYIVSRGFAHELWGCETVQFDYQRISRNRRGSVKKCGAKQLGQPLRWELHVKGCFCPTGMSGSQVHSQFYIPILGARALACWHSQLACQHSRAQHSRAQHSRAQHSLQCIFPGVHPGRYVCLDLDSGCFYWNRKNALE